MTLNKQIILTFLVLICIIVFFGITDVDLYVEDFFYNFSEKKWILNKNIQPYKFIFYDGIKKILIIFALSILFVLIFFWKQSWLKEYKKNILVVVLSAIIVPLVVGGLKRETNMPCPKDEMHYGGVYPRTAVWEKYPQEFTLTHKRSKCWPAGHASGGFALMSLFFLFRKKRNKYIALGVALVIGWSMGLYKMLIGDHFFSHTVITMVLAWFLILVIAKIVYSIEFNKREFFKK